ncbi:MAG: type II toxin-antitoxin system Phd/YefM family antitoxin [Planctomycetales bacterium]|nr:type II toxin-antitoxin system Phd/YefM family antitoxin [Planctomycetales bacterium]
MEIGVAEIRDNLADALNRVAYAGERVILQRRGKGVAALVSIEDLKLLEQIEDQHDLTEARKALAEKGPNIPLEEVARKLGITLPPRAQKESKTKRPATRSRKRSRATVTK